MFVTLAAFAALGTACPDPAGEFDSFEERYEEIHGKPTTGAVTTGGGACDYELLEGEFLFSLSASILRAKPVMFRTTVTVDENKLSMVFQPLKQMDKNTPVGEPISFGPFDIGENGTFAAALGTLTISGEANPITPGAPIVAENVVLDGSLCTGTDGFVCGQVTGNVTAPTTLDLATSTFGMVKIVDGVLPEKSVIDCNQTQGMY